MAKKVGSTGTFRILHVSSNVVNGFLVSLKMQILNIAFLAKVRQVVYTVTGGTSEQVNKNTCSVIHCLVLARHVLLKSMLLANIKQ